MIVLFGDKARLIVPTKKGKQKLKDPVLFSIIQLTSFPCLYFIHSQHQNLAPVSDKAAAGATSLNCPQTPSEKVFSLPFSLYNQFSYLEDFNSIQRNSCS